MKLRASIPSALIALSALVMMSLLVGCQMISQTHTKGTDAAIAADVCRVWQPISYSSRDTPETRQEIKVNNAARTAYCGEVK